MSGPSGGNGGGDFGGGGGSPTFDCSKVSIKTNVISPNSTVLASLSKGDILAVSLQTPTGPLLAIAKRSRPLGAIFTKDPAALINCINNGYSYKAEILSISGGDVQILITNK